MKSFIKYLIPLIIGILIATWFFKKTNQIEVHTEGDVIIEKIKSVKKIIVTEGYFSEVYNYKEAKNYFYDIISFEKKALLLVKGKVQINYDLEQMEYSVNTTSKTITITKVPKPETTIEPTIKYYDLQESTFNTFSASDYNKLNQLAIKKLKEEINKSGLYFTAEKSLQQAIEQLQFVGKELGWKVIVKGNT